MKNFERALQIVRYRFAMVRRKLEGRKASVNLKANGIIYGIDSDKGGCWKVK